MFPVNATAPDWVGIVILAGALVWYAYDRVTNRERDGLEAARQAYVDGEIPLSEFERRAELVLDDSAAEVRAVVEAVPGVGPETSAAIAMEFDSVATLEAASRKELAAVNGVGPERARAIRDYLA